MRHHTDWLKARLSTITALRTPPNAAPPSFVKIFVTRAEFPEPHDDVKVLPPYIVLHPTDGNASRSRMSGGRRHKSPRWVVHSVGASAAQAGWLGEAVEQALVPGGVPVRPAIEGENTFPFWWNSPTPVELDRDSTPPVFLHVSECGFDTDLTDPRGGSS